MRRLLIGGALLILLTAAGLGRPGEYRPAAAAEPPTSPLPVVEQMYPMSPYMAPMASPYRPMMPYTAPLASPYYPAPSAVTYPNMTPTITVTSQAAGGVRIVEFSFNPSSITVAAGNSITWTNAGTVSHTTTADSGAWNSGPLRPGASFSQTFNTAGTFSYHCMIHPTMVGTVTVTSSGGVSVSPSAAATSASVNYSSGWNLVSGPAGTTISGTNGSLYTLRAGDASYETVASGSPLAAGAGYWAYFNASTSMPIPAAAAQPMTLQLPAGQFVMVGDPGGTPVTVTGADTVLTYDATNGYQPVTKLNPGQGAWAFSANGGTLSISPA